MKRISNTFKFIVLRWTTHKSESCWVVVAPTRFESVENPSEKKNLRIKWKRKIARHTEGEEINANNNTNISERASEWERVCHIRVVSPRSTSVWTQTYNINVEKIYVARERVSACTCIRNTTTFVLACLCCCFFFPLCCEYVEQSFQAGSYRSILSVWSWYFIKTRDQFFRVRRIKILFFL